MYGDGAITNTAMQKQVKRICENRFERMYKPCKGCMYRNRELDKDGTQQCVFDNFPRDWEIK